MCQRTHTQPCHANDGQKHATQLRKMELAGGTAGKRDQVQQTTMQSQHGPDRPQRMQPHVSRESFWGCSTELSFHGFGHHFLETPVSRNNLLDVRVFPEEFLEG